MGKHIIWVPLAILATLLAVLLWLGFQAHPQDTPESSPETTAALQEDQAAPPDPTDWRLMLVNPWNAIPQGYQPELVTCTPEEVFVDLGAYTGDTVLSYLKNYGEDCYQRIYCYEITPETFQVLQETLAPYRDIVCRQKGVGDAEGTLSLVNHQTSASSNTLGHETGAAVPVTTLDTDIPEPITMIKADIEGFEQKALQGAKNHILRDHPKLLFSVYHNNEDLWKIPRMIHALSEAYTFHLRYNSSPLYPTEITLFAL